MKLKTNQQHPITPPPELVRQWAHMLEQHTDAEVFTQAARWGADQELEACCEWLEREVDSGWGLCAQLRTARRPKPPSLKAGAIEVLDELDGLFELPAGHYNTILRALEQLDD